LETLKRAAIVSAHTLHINNMLVYFHCIGHTALKRFNDVVTITVVIVFLAVFAMH